MVRVLAALLAAAPLAAAAAPGAIQDDLAAALAQAKARGVPVLVDVWAPWCPSCRFMRATVMQEPRVLALSARFVRLDVNTESPGTAAFQERYPIDAWPTLLVLDPATEQAVVRWSGTATAAEVERIAADGERAIRAGRASAADQALARADARLAARDHAAAAEAYRDALARGGKAWPSRARAAEALVQALGFAGDPAACLAGAKGSLPLLAGSARLRALAQALACAGDLPEAAARTKALGDLEPQARSALAAKETLADDRSTLYEALAVAREARGDRKGARAVGREWLADLDRAAKGMRTPVARAALDGQRLEAAMRAGEVGRVLGALQDSERELPDDFVPAANVTAAYLALGRPREALLAADRALALASGPRRIRVLVQRAEALEGLGNRVAARAALERALSDAAALPEAVRPRRPVADARRLLEALGGAAE